jgi:DNA-binding NtrC family response regulator
MHHESILVIDNDDNVRNTLAAILLQSGYRVVSAKSVCVAIESLINDDFNLALLDLKNSDVEGLALLSNLHMIYPDLKLVVMSAYSSLNIAELAERFGAQGYFLKPVDPVQLLACIEKILSNPQQKKHSLWKI